ncbi:SAICAR synthase-like protein [Testicularia cyperi]|uniref:Kinase n=1 Tax=Testicularia cyperi TaxID=1882483 RepID=A0A317XLK0_9BASI|nr:SAICAR synthase-like protein [Testicularia cyperi]
MTSSSSTTQQTAEKLIKPAALAHQVAGHPGGVQTIYDGLYVVKDCLERELRFYEEVEQATSVVGPDQERRCQLLQRLREFMPTSLGAWHGLAERLATSDNPSHLGTTTAIETTPSESEDPKQPSQDGQDSEPLSVKTDGADGQNGDNGDTSKTSNNGHRIVLSNLTAGFAKPNVADIKLGTQLWDEDASEEKRKRMDLAAQSTTSGTHGIRLTGWQVYDNETGTFHAVPKTFGKTIKSEHLPLGVRMLLASPETQDAELADLVVPGTSCRRSPGKDGQGERDENTPHGAQPTGSDDTYLPSLPRELMHDLLKHRLIPALEQLVGIFKELEVRMRGASVLIVYEGQLDRLREGGGSKTLSVSALAQVHLIDFGHATLVPGQGPDEGVLLGLTTLLTLFQEQLDRMTLPSESRTL